MEIAKDLLSSSIISVNQPDLEIDNAEEVPTQPHFLPQEQQPNGEANEIADRAERRMQTQLEEPKRRVKIPYEQFERIKRTLIMLVKENGEIKKELLIYEFLNSNIKSINSESDFNKNEKLLKSIIRNLTEKKQIFIEIQYDQHVALKLHPSFTDNNTFE